MTKPSLHLNTEDTWPLALNDPLVDRLESAWNSMNHREKLRVRSLREAGLNWLLATARVCGTFPPSTGRTCPVS